MPKERLEARYIRESFPSLNGSSGFNEGEWYPVMSESLGTLRILDNHRTVRYMVASHWEVRTVKN